MQTMNEAARKHVYHNQYNSKIGSSSMHILILPSWYPDHANEVGGVFFREQAVALAKSGLAIGVIAPKLRSLRRLPLVNFGSRSEYENDRGVHTYRWHGMAWFPRISYANSLLWLKAGRRLFDRYVAEHGMPDIIHAHSALNAGLLAASIGQQRGVPVVLTEHSSAFGRRLVSDRQKRQVSQAFHGSQRLIAVSPQLATLLREEYPATEERWLWVPNIVNSRFFDRPVSKGSSSSRSASFRLLNIAMMTPNKGQEDLLKAFAKAFKGIKDVELWLGGDGPLRKELETSTKLLGMDTQVKFLGILNRHQVQNALHQTDVFVLSSHYETFGVVIIEALAVGRPVIATRCGGPECIIGEGDGLVVTPQDVDELAEAMRTMRMNIGSYDAEALRARCRARFSEDAVVKQLTAIYRGLLAEGLPRSLSRKGP